MRLARLHPHMCERVREQLSLALDGELSQLEHAHLDGHLAKCASCRAFGAELGAATRVIRTTPLEELSFPISVPASRRIARRVFQATAAAAVVLAAGIGSIDLANREAERSASPAFPTRAVPQTSDALSVDRIRTPGQMANGFRGRMAR
jgi:anti-sigma factor RsiW